MRHRAQNAPACCKLRRARRSALPGHLDELSSCESTCVGESGPRVVCLMGTRVSGG